jgi:DNA-binding MarR family transcriptional regulator
MHISMSEEQDPCWRVANECAAAKLRRASRLVSNAFDKAVAPVGIRSTQFSLLVAIHLAGKMSLTDLAARLDLDRTTLTRNVQLLMREGFCREAAVTDRRRRLLTLTEAGERLVKRTFPLWEAAQRSVVAGMGERRWARLTKELESVAAVATRSGSR